MAYTLEAILGTETVLRTAVVHEPAVVVPLRGGMALVPMTDGLHDAVTDGTSQRQVGFWKLPGGADRLLARWSMTGPVAYVEADYFGGVGSQRAALWLNGVVVLGPLVAEEHQPWPAAGSPISQVLARLGVDRVGYVDEFAAVGLAEHRHTEDWLH
jgi:hypothetical protein